MAKATIELVVPGMSENELNNLIMGEGFAGESIFSKLLKDEPKWSARYYDGIVESFSNDVEKGNSRPRFKKGEEVV